MQSLEAATETIVCWCASCVNAQVCDIAAIVSIAHAAGALVCVDNSFLTPLYQRPLQLGADISMTSGTKYIGGHGDTTLGMLAVRDPELGKQLYFLQNSEGAGLAPMDCWLALRGLKTVSVHARMQLQLAGTMAAWLLPGWMSGPGNVNVLLSAWDQCPGETDRLLHMNPWSRGAQLLTGHNTSHSSSHDFVFDASLSKRWS